jgi:hypothetical protein
MNLWLYKQRLFILCKDARYVELVEKLDHENKLLYNVLIASAVKGVSVG